MTVMCRFRSLVLVGAIAIATASCGDVVRQGRSPVMLVVNSLTAARGANQIGTFGGSLDSDVITLVTTGGTCTTTNPCPTIFSDIGQAVLSVTMKDIGTPGNPTSPSANNAVTINRYHVDYRRTDGRNTPGVDVPYPIDGAATGTVTGGGTLSLSFEIVRHTSKEETPLVQLQGFGAPIISTVATVTLYGADQVGNAVSTSGSIQINFGNFGDPQ
jgi:hypothetical protein